jgi:outer membrane protein assembly factor BamB
MPPFALIPGATFDPNHDVLACARGEAGCPAANTPAIADGRLYFTFWTPGAANAGVKAVLLKEGAQTTLTPLWTSDTLVGGSGSSPTLSADGSRLYVTDNGGSLLAIETRTGTVMWTYPLGYKSGGSVSISPDGLIMPAGGGQSPVMAFKDKGDSAVLLWRRDDLVNRGIATQAEGHLAYAAVTRGHFKNDLVVVDTLTGRSIDRTELPGTTIFSVGTTIGPDATVYVSTIRGTVFALRPR